MAVTGAILYGFVFAHMAGNLQFFLGAPWLDTYGEHLKEVPALIWTIRGVLFLALVLHVTSAISLFMLKKAARPIGYKRHGNVQASVASRSMALGGVVLLAFIIFHIQHFTIGNLHPSFQHGEVWRNVVVGFRVVPVAIGYVVAMIALAFHLYHGVWSSFRSLGLGHPGYSHKLRIFAKVFAVVVTLGFASIPISVLLGLVGKGTV